MPHLDMGKILQMLPDLAVLAAMYLLALLPRWKRAGSRTLAVRMVFFLYMVCVLGVTLLPVLANLPKLAGNRYVPMELEPFRDLRNGYGNAARQLTLNVVMTVPFGFLWPLCGFSLIALYDLKVIEKIFAILESGTQEPAGQN